MEGLTRPQCLVFFCLKSFILTVPCSAFSCYYCQLCFSVAVAFIEHVLSSERNIEMQKQRSIGKHLYPLMLLAIIPTTLFAGSLDHAIETQVKNDVAAQTTQRRIDNLADEKAQMLAEYREVLRQTDSLRAYNKQLDTLVVSQKSELDSMDLQLQNIETTQRDIVPLMLKMIETLTLFVELDVPFLPEEREQRIIQLQTLMERADVTLAEKYRRILEAYQVETEYGRTLEAYQAELVLDDTTRTVDFLRVGRVSLYYLTLDGLEAGMWLDNKWQMLDDEYRQGISQALKVAKKQLPPDLLVLPIKTVEAAQ